MDKCYKSELTSAPAFFFFFNIYKYMPTYIEIRNENKQRSSSSCLWPGNSSHSETLVMMSLSPGATLEYS